MSYDPVPLFALAKEAAEKAPSTKHGPTIPRFTDAPDPNSPDPGERAVAGAMVVAGSAAGRIVQKNGKAGFGELHLHGSVPAQRSLVYDIPGDIAAAPTPSGKTIGEIRRKAHRTHLKGPSPQSAKLLGVYSVQARPTAFPVPPDLSEVTRRKDAKRLIKGYREKIKELASGPAALDHKLGEIQESVDSFIRDKKLDKKGVTINIRKGPVTWLSGGSSYNIANKRVTLDNVSKALTLHELGHAADYTGSRIGRARRLIEPVLQTTMRFAVPAALIAGDQIKELLPGTIDDKAIDFLQRNAPHVAAATIAATTLYPEAKASMLALKHVRKTEGRRAAKEVAKALRPAFGTYLLGAIPGIVGMALAKKYMQEARDEKAGKKPPKGSEKTAGLVSDTVKAIRSNVKDLKYVGAQIRDQSSQIIKDKKVIKNLGRAARNIGASPEFAFGAYASAVPAGIATLYMYGSPAGKEIRSRLSEGDLHTSVPVIGGHRIPKVHSTSEEWRENNTLKYTGLVTLGAALAGGVMTKLFSDLAKVL